MSVDVLYRCARVDCRAEEVVEGHLSEEAAERDAPRLIRSALPTEWGYDEVGRDAVLHCPEHRDVA